MTDPRRTRAAAGAGQPGEASGRPASDPAEPSLVRRLVSGGLWAFAGKVVAAGAGVLISVLLTRLLPPAEVGAYFLALSVVTAASLLGRSGLEKTVLQVTAESLGLGDKGRARAAVRKVFVLAGVTIAAVALLMALGGGRWLAERVFTSQPMARIGMLMGPWTAYIAFEMLLAETFRGFNDIPRASLYGSALGRVLCLLGLLILLLLTGGAGLETVVVVTVASGALALAPAAIGLARKLRSLRAPPQRPVALGRVLQVTWPLLVSNVTLFMVGHADLWVLGAFRPDAEVALYGVAVRLVLLVGMSLTVVNAVLPPLIGSLYARRDLERLERTVRTTASVAALPSAAVLLAFIVAGGPILGLAFGPFYRDAALVLALLSVGQLVNVWVGSCGYVLIMTGHQRDLMWIALVAGLISIAGGLAAVGAYGAVGVATAVAAGTIVQQALMLWLARRRCGIWTHASLRLLPGPARQLGRWLRERARGS